jgi:ankyrin repeat protein
MVISASNFHSFNQEEVLRLLSKGADINFQDANRNFSTPLHLAVEKRNIELIKLLLKFNPSRKIRNMNGERPRDIALSLNYFDIVKLLDEYRESTEEKLSDQNSADKESFDSGVTLELQAEKFSTYSSSYTSSRVQFLLSISKIDPHFKRTSFNMETVKQIYVKLDENIFLRPLIKVAKEIRRLEIYFLHDQSSNELSSCSIENLNGTLFICGPSDGIAQFSATLVHKLLHYAMNHINDNDCKPYRRKQAEKMFRFRKIVTVYKRKIETLNPVVQRVFDLPESLWDAELVACVPYILAFYNDDLASLHAITESHKELFDFYSEFVLKDIDDHLVRNSLNKFKERPVEGSSFGITRPYDPYKTERLEEKYGSNYRHNKRNNRDLERICVIL